MFKKPSPEFIDLLKRAGSNDPRVAFAAQSELALAVQMPLREGLLLGDTLDNIFERMVFEPGQAVEFPLSTHGPGEEDELVAFTNPGHGRIPEHAVEGDYTMVPTYSVTAAIDMLLRHVRDARYDVVGQNARKLEAAFTKKMNDDGWNTVLAAAVDRNIMVYDADAANGQLTKRLVSLMKTVMRRNAGGNSASVGRGRLTDLYLSVEGLEDIRNWGVDQVDEITRREIYVSADGASPMTRVFGVTLHELYELGQGQQYQTYFEDNLSGQYPGSDVELVVGLDLENRDSFVMPIREELTIFNDETMHRQQRIGWYGWQEYGCAVLDSRRVLLGSF